MFYFTGQRRHTRSWNQMIKSSELRTQLGLRARVGKTQKDRVKRFAKERT